MLFDLPKEFHFSVPLAVISSNQKAWGTSFAGGWRSTALARVRRHDFLNSKLVDAMKRERKPMNPQIVSWRKNRLLATAGFDLFFSNFFILYSILLFVHTLGKNLKADDHSIVLVMCS